MTQFKIIAILEKSNKWLTTMEIANKLGCDVQRIRPVMLKLRRKLWKKNIKYKTIQKKTNRQLSYRWIK
jgi:transcription initiation factor IIE alpha subunit